MKTNILLALVALVIFGCSPVSTGKGKVQQKVVPKGPGKIACDEAEHDYGKVAQGAEVSHVFKIKNTGSGILKIDRAEGG